MTTDISPPRTPLAFRVGVVGHRPNRLPKDEESLNLIRAKIADILSAVGDAVSGFAVSEPNIYASGAQRLLAISALAEGSDRMFAGAALDMGWRLCVPMPFPQEDYEADFGGSDSASTAEFRTLLHQAETHDALSRFELDGTREDEGEAYAAAARILLNQSDLLIAVWDGEESRGKGSTVETVQEAIGFHVPVIWVDSRKPFSWRLLRQWPVEGPVERPADTEATNLADTIKSLVHEELAIPVEHSHPPTHGDKHALTPNALANAYFEERRPRFNLHFGWKLFRNLASGDRPLFPRLRTSDYVEQTKPEIHGPIDSELLSHFAWADKLADYYADAHRTGVILTSILSASAVLLALLPIAIGIHHPIMEIVLIGGELVVLFWLSFSISIVRKKHYHEKWLEYRLLAEWIRQLRLISPLGGGRPLLRSRAHQSVYGEPTRSWMYWHIRGIARARALPSTIADRAHLAKSLDGINSVIDGQIAFHTTTMERSERIHGRLHRITKWTVVITIAAIFTHFVEKLVALYLGHGHDTLDSGAHEGVIALLLSGGVLLCAAFLPAAGASLANINNQGEFARLGKRARAMRDSFLRLKREADELKEKLESGEASFLMGPVTALANHVAMIMLEEVVDWRVVVLDLPQGLE